MPAETLRRTPLHDRHAAAGARIVPFAGWEMPVQYEGVRPEHLAVRTSAGLFDVSHMGEIETSGPDAERFLQRILSNDVAKIAPDGAQYAVLCRDDGGILDDLFTYRVGSSFLTVTNASNHDKDLAWFRRQAEGFDVEVRDSHSDWAMLALQGPDARAILGRHLDGDQPARMRVQLGRVAGVDGVLVCGTGYTGEDGVELLIPPDGAGRVWDALTGDGARPVGLGARDTLRLEVCFHLYGNDMDETRNPVEAGLGWVCKPETGFIGAEALEGFEPTQKLVPFTMGHGIPRQGNPVLVDGEPAGEVTSGTLSPCLETGIGMAYVPLSAAAAGTRIEVDVRGKVRAAEVRKKPLYEKES